MILYIVLGFICSFIFLWLSHRRKDCRQEKQRQKEMAEHAAKWNALTNEERQAQFLENYYLPTEPAHYEPLLQLNDAGEPCLPNLYLSDFGLTLMPLQHLGFTDKEIETFKKKMYQKILSFEITIIER